MSARSILKSLTPPIVSRSIRGRRGGDTLRFEGRPSSWPEAVKQSSGYSSETILERVAAATRDVVDGRAAYERDSVTFDRPATPFPIVAGLLRSAALDGGRLAVIDVGGSLGSTYRQCRPFLSILRSITWYVVEQPGFVSLGREEFSTDELTFHETLSEVPREGPPATVVLSSVLQYLESPHELLDELGGVDARHLLIDRTPLSDSTMDRLCIQHVPRRIYRASYPCWIFSRSRLLQRLSADWTVISDYPSTDGSYRTKDGLQFEFRGLILERR